MIPTAAASSSSQRNGVDTFGRLEWIGIRPTHREPVEPVSSVEVVPGRGLVGDHYVAKRGGGREVTLIQHEDLAAIALDAGLPEVQPALLRRNLVISGIRLVQWGKRLIQIGEVILRPTGPCVPCSRMDEALGPWGRVAMSGRGGLTAVIVVGGLIRVGDEVSIRTELT